MKGALILVLALFCYFQSVSAFSLQSQLNQELASIIKDDIMQITQQREHSGGQFDFLERPKRGVKLIKIDPKFRGVQRSKRLGKRHTAGKTHSKRMHVKGKGKGLY